MTWEFCTEPNFEEKLEWTRAFVRDEVMPLEVLDLDDARLRELIKPLQVEVKKQGLWAAFLPPHLGGSGWGPQIAKKGIATPQQDIELIKSRLRDAEDHYRARADKGGHKP